jgi:hypothetical protein
MSLALQQQQRITETESRTANDITDLLDCFCGVAQATDVMSANFLFGTLGFAQKSVDALLQTISKTSCARVRNCSRRLLHIKC